jgi:hypothetical protein
MTDGEITILDKEYTSANALFAPGSSGGAIYLDDGHYLIGITNAGINGYNWMGMCRPIKDIYKWMDQIGYSFLYNGSKDISIIERDLLRKELNDKLLKIQDIMGERDALKSEVDTLLKRIEDLEKRLENLERQKNEERQKDNRNQQGIPPEQG